MKRKLSALILTLAVMAAPAHAESTVNAALKDRLFWLSERSRVLAENVANADTPRYLPKDVAQPTGKKGVMPVVPSVTHANHIATGQKAKPGIEIVNAKVLEMKPSGNGVDLEDQMMKVAETGNEYQQNVALLKRWHMMTKTALGK